jgi:crotonobetainyl-CoA:carnitine CoA-transferase CaiB-like acyl-CoA transferase
MKSHGGSDGLLIQSRPHACFGLRRDKSNEGQQKTSRTKLCTHQKQRRAPVTLSRTPSKMASRPPEFGEQTDDVLAEFGFSADEIGALRQAKVV